MLLDSPQTSINKITNKFPYRFMENDFGVSQFGKH